LPEPQTENAPPKRGRMDCPRFLARRGKLLASCRDGCTEAILLAHGFTVDQIVELVRAGLATAHTQRVIVARRAVEIAHVKITEAGRRALTDKPTQ
jgi:hypothetical protein